MVLGLNPGPHTCQAITLALSYISSDLVWLLSNSIIDSINKMPEAKADENKRPAETDFNLEHKENKRRNL